MSPSQWEQIVGIAGSIGLTLAECVGGVFASNLAPAMSGAVARLRSDVARRSVHQGIMLTQAEARVKVEQVSAAFEQYSASLHAYTEAPREAVPAAAQSVCAAGSALLCALEELQGIKASVRRDLGTLRSALRALSRHSLPDESGVLVLAQLRAQVARDPTDTVVKDALWHTESRGRQ